MKFAFLSCLVLAAPLAKRGLSDVLNTVIEDFYNTNSEFTYEFIKLAINRIGDGFLDKLVLPENTTLTVALPPDSSLTSLLSNSNEEIQKFISYHVFFNQTVNGTESAAYQSVEGSFVKVSVNQTENTVTALTRFEKPSEILASAFLIQNVVELLFLNDSLIVPASIYNTSAHYSWTSLTAFINTAAGQEEQVTNVKPVNTTVPKETTVSIPGFGNVVIPLGSTYLIPSEIALQSLAPECLASARRLLEFHTIANHSYFANSFTNKTVNVTESISAQVVNGSVFFQGPFNSAKVIQADLLVEGGVGHVIDAVLFPFESCPN